MKGFQELIVWQRSMNVAKDVYNLTRQFPEGEKFGLMSQMQRAAVSIPSNIAEGHARGTKKEFRLFLSFARGSAAELLTQLILARNLGYITEKQFAGLNNDMEILAKMLSSLFGKVQ